MTFQRSCRFRIEVSLQDTHDCRSVPRGSAPGYDEDALRASLGTILENHHNKVTSSRELTFHRNPELEQVQTTTTGSLNLKKREVNT